MGVQSSCCCTDKNDDAGLLVAARKPGDRPGDEKDAELADCTPAAYSIPDEAKVAGLTTEPRPPNAVSAGNGTVAASEMSVIIERQPDMTIGLNLDAIEEHAAFVDDILGGAIRSWNDAHADHAQLKRYDRIIAINDVQGNTNALLAEMRKSVRWHLRVHRPTELRLSMDLERNPTLGLDLKYSPNGVSLLVSSIGDGAIKEWNKTASHPCVPGDRIIEVNGRRGNAPSLLQAATQGDRLELVILHFAT
mmetsp:Transcript_35991/g.103514  ORF Transcript_35991/g.103514 Transcript_35991/m.103514 type:complete len:249 (-) Transcript_35991:141-887(-)